MNAALDSPLEALAINYLAYGFITAVNNIWAWIAVITAAVSFWRLRALPPSFPPTPEQRTTSQDHASSTKHTVPSPVVAESAAAEPATTSGSPASAAPAKACCSRVLEREGSVKTKFSLYYEKESVDAVENEERGGGEEAAVATRELDDWERVMEMRMGDMGWYGWQDRTVLDGSVVRLWEGHRPRNAAAQVVVGGVAW